MLYYQSYNNYEKYNLKTAFNASLNSIKRFIGILRVNMFN